MARMLEASLCFVMFVVSVHSAPTVTACEDSGLMVAGSRYGCNVLLNKTLSDKRHLGVYQRRDSICEDTVNYEGCCKTCKQVLKNECKDDTLNIADGGYNCKALVNKTYSDEKKLGVYEKNIQYCNESNYSGCCKTCQNVLREANTTSSTEQGESTDNGDQGNSGGDGGPVNNAENEIKTPQGTPSADPGRLYAPNHEHDQQNFEVTGINGAKFNIKVHEEPDGSVDVSVSFNRKK